MDIVKLPARIRNGQGTTLARRTRMAGWIPAAYYGRNRQTKSIEVKASDFLQLVRHKQTNKLIDLVLPGEETDSISVIKEMQNNIIKDNDFLHLDFQHVAMNEKITVQCRVEILGIPLGVKEQGGILEHPARYLTIECLPVDIPEKISVDVTELEIGDAIHVKEIKVDKIAIKNAPDEVIAVVSVPSKEELPTPAAPAEGEAVPVEGAPVEGAAAAPGAAPGAPGAAPGTAPGAAAPGAAAAHGAAPAPGKAAEAKPAGKEKGGEKKGKEKK